jgi:hypothetical protein
MSKGLGVEVDFGLSYVPQKDMIFKLGLSGMFGTETLGHIKVTENPNLYPTGEYKDNGTWAYLMFVFKPNFYSN